MIFSVFLKFAYGALLPVAIAFILYFCLCPGVDWMQRQGVRRWLGSMFVVLVLTGTFSASVYYLSSPLYSVIELSGQKIKNIERKLVILEAPMKKISETQKEVSKITTMTKPKVTEVRISESNLAGEVLDHLRLFLLNFVTICVLLFFLLIYGDIFFCRLTQSQLKGPLQAKSLLGKVQEKIGFYLLAISGINIVLGLAVGVSLYIVGFENPFLWGVIAGLLNFIPYLGCLLGVSLVFILSVSDQGGILQMALPAFIYLAINTLEGQFLTPIILGSALALNPLVILLSLLYWAAVWGVAGLFVAVPALIILHTVLAHHSKTKKLSETLVL